MPYLELRDELRELASGDTVVGSGAQTTWRLQKLDLAAKHFAVRVTEDGGASVRAMSPQNVVLVNGRQIGLQPTRLEEGDVITAGQARFCFARDASVRREQAAQKAAPEPHLVDERARRAYPVSRKSVTIGRDALSSIFVGDPQVSRFHADIRAEAGAFVLYAMGSAGTRVNGQRVSVPRVLEEGDRLEIGDTSFRFTQQPLAAGVRVVDAADEVDPALTQRATSSHPAQRDENTGEGARYKRPRSVPIALLGIIVLVLIAVAALFVLL